MDMAEKIKMLRKEKGLTLEEVGERVGVGKSTVRKWESGMIANMRRDKIALLAKALGVSQTYLMGWDDEKASTEPTVKESVEAEMIDVFRTLNDEGQKEVMRYMKYISSQDEFKASVTDRKAM